jgi:hypothetical protein
MTEDFDSFAQRQSQNEEMQRQNHERLAKETKPEWSVLKGLTSRFALDGKEFGGYKFEWSPYSAMYPDFLRLKDVAVTFLDRGERNGVPQNCRIRFTRRPLEPGRAWVDDETPLEPLDWSLEPRIVGESLVWFVAELREAVSSADLAEKIAIELSKYHATYEEAYGRLPVVRRFGLE